MALSSLLRGALNGSRVRPLLGISNKLTPITTTISFHSQTDKKTLPEVRNFPQQLGTVRQFTTTTALWSKHADHSKIWTLERGLSVGLLGVLPLGIMFPNVLFDVLMAVSVVMHAHWGIEAIVADYIRPVLFGAVIPKVAHGLVYVLSIAILVGLLNLTFNNAGLGNSIKLLWRI